MSNGGALDGVQPRLLHGGVVALGEQPAQGLFVDRRRADVALYQGAGGLPAPETGDVDPPRDAPPGLIDGPIELLRRNLDGQGGDARLRLFGGDFHTRPRPT